MEAIQTKEDLVLAFTDRRIGRRQFLKGLVALGVTVAAARVYANAIHPVFAGLIWSHDDLYYGDEYYGGDYPPQRPPPNRPPAADAGPDQTVAEVPGGTPVTLDGTGSSDPDGDSLTYQWWGPFLGAPASGPTPTVVFPAVGVWSVGLSVMDGRGGAASDTVTIAIVEVLPETLSLAVSSSPNRTGAIPLAGATVSGEVAVFVSPVFPETDIRRVRFRLDGEKGRSENHAPYDFAGGSASTASMADSTAWGDGSHTMKARVNFPDGTHDTLSATFIVHNDGDGLPPPEPGPDSLVLAVSTAPDRSGAVPLGGAVVAGDIAVFLAPVFPDAGVRRVTFLLDGERVRRENHAPFDFAGGSSAAAVLVDTTEWSNGTHSITARVDFEDGTRRGYSGTFTVDN